MPTPRSTRPPDITSSVATCLASSGVGWAGARARLTKTRTRSVTAAAVASVTIISGLWKVMRSPQEMLEGALVGGTGPRKGGGAVAAAGHGREGESDVHRRTLRRARLPLRHRPPGTTANVL